MVSVSAVMSLVGQYTGLIVGQAPRRRRRRRRHWIVVTLAGGELKT